MAVTPSILADGILYAHQNDMFVSAGSYYVTDVVITNTNTSSARTINFGVYTAVNQANRYLIPRDMTLVAGGTAYLSVRASLSAYDKLLGWADNNTDVTYVVWGGENL